MNFLTEVISERFLYALGWALLHSIWQGILVAVFTAVLLVFLHRQASRVRYIMSATSLLLILGLAVFTFVKLYVQYPGELIGNGGESASGSVTLTTVAQLDIKQSLQVQPASSIAVWNVFYTKYASYFQKHLPLIVILWVLGITVLFLRFLGGLAYSRRLKYYKVTSLSQEWQDKVVMLASDLGIRRAVNLMESAIVKVPVVIGYFKPVILLPAGLITTIPAEQLEVILLHELAHVYRRDYLVNILQSLIDILFFYHPAVWWLSAMIRQERENCCDDLVLEYTPNTSTYARALTNMEAIQHAPELVMALGKNRGSLLNRVRRILDNPQIRPDFTDGLVVAFFFFVCFAALIFQAKAELPSKDKFADLKQSHPEAFSGSEEQFSDSLRSDTTVRLEFMGSFKPVVSQLDHKGEVLAQDAPESKGIGKELISKVDIDYEVNEVVKSDSNEPFDYLNTFEGTHEPYKSRYDFAFSTLHPNIAEVFSFKDSLKVLPSDSLKKWKERRDKLRAIQFSSVQDGKNRVMIFNGKNLQVIVNGEKTVVWDPEEFEKFGVVIDSLDSAFKYVVIPELPDLADLPEIPEVYRIYDVLKLGDEIDWQDLPSVMERDSFRIVGANEIDRARIAREKARLEREMERQMFDLERKQEALERLKERLKEREEQEMESTFLKMEKASEIRRALYAQLLEDGLVEKGERLSFTLSKNELFINGSKQPRSVHKEYLRLLEKLQGEPLDKEQQFVFSN